MSKDTFYFSHDYNSRNDVKIKKLLSKHGMSGYGLFWAIIEELYNNTNVLPTDYDTISYDLRVDKSLVKSVITEFDLFVFDGDFFGSMSVQKRLDERNEKSAKARKSVNYRWGKNTNVLQSNYDANTIKERKVNKKKEKEIKENSAMASIPEFNEFLNYALEHKPKANEELIRLKYESWKANGWKTGGQKSKPIKNWKSTLLNTLPYIQETNKQTNPIESALSAYEGAAKMMGLK